MHNGVERLADIECTRGAEGRGLRRRIGPLTVGRVPGEPGAWTLLFGDMLMFGAMFVTFLVSRGRSPEEFVTGRGTLHIGVGLTNTLILMTSSLFVVMLVGGVRTNERSAARWCGLAAIGCGVLFIALKSYEYRDLIVAGHTPGTSPFYMYYFVLTGLHLFHVAIGIAVLSAVTTQTRRRTLSRRRIAAVEAGACFWHLVDLLWIVLFALLYLIGGP